MAKRPYRLGFTETGVEAEQYGSFGSPEAAVKRRDEIVEELAAKRHSWLMDGWWVVLGPSGLLAEHTLGVGKDEGKPLPVFVRTSG